MPLYWTKNELMLRNHLILNDLGFYVINVISRGDWPALKETGLKNGNQIDRNRFNIELLEQKEGLMIMAS